MSQNEPVMSQRERFEHWFSDQGKWPQAVERSGEGYKLMQADDAWRTWQAACPEGWQALPRAATPEMLDCIHDWTRHTEERYAALLEVAPKLEAVCKSPG
tara:strand:- start:907 stop:1206 length:300 start_codon:yes stop_codon:yes gene_type:complete